jgi:hypothetical protein
MIELTSALVVVQMEIALLINVTAPLCARAATQLILAPASRVMLDSATMSPWNAVVEPSVAELPTLKNTLLA